MNARSFFFSIPFAGLLVSLVLPSCTTTKESPSSASSSGSTSGQPPPAPTVSPVDGGSDPQTGVVRYLALGDSLTQGVGAPNPDTGSYPALLSEKWRARGCKVELQNHGIASYKSADVIADELPDVGTFKPTLVTLQVGANDVANSVSIDVYRANVKTILSTSKGSGARVIVMPQNEWFRSPQGETYGPGLSEKRDAFDAVLMEETKAAGAEFVDLRLLFKQHADQKLWIDDGLHPTPAAYEAWASELARVIPSPCGK